MAGITPQEVSAYFSKVLGEKVDVTDLKQTFPGVSRETWLVQALVGGHRQGLPCVSTLLKERAAPRP